ncbi:MAG: recombinase family protein, partial [Alphaproteobacteria bacterium]|nr:recombinase family protein [Alphaproteobacteria bacterium]
MTEARQAVVLVRVSTREQEEGYSIDAQKYRLEEYCQRNELEVIKVFEIIESSTKGDREKFKKMLQFAKRQKGTTAVVADKVDRVQRRLSEIPLLEEAVKSGKIELHFRTEGYVIHKDSQSHAKLMWGMNVLMAQSYTDSLSDNVKRSLDHKVRKGEYIRSSPLGYLNAEGEGGNKTIIVDPVRGPIIKRIFEEYATGQYTMSDMARKAQQWGLRSKKNNKIAKSVIHTLLQNPFYYGEMRIKGELWKHNYEPLISWQTFNMCQEVRNGYGKKKFRYSGKDYVFRGSLTCAVTGNVVTADTKKKTYANGQT